MSSSFFRRPGEESSGSSSGSESDESEAAGYSDDQRQDLVQEPGETGTTESFSSHGSISFGDGPDLPVNPLANVDQHRTNLLSALLEDFARNQACEMMNKASPEVIYNKSSAQIQPLARKLYEQLVQSFAQTGLLPTSTINDGPNGRHTRATYLAGVERIALGNLQNNELLEAHAHPPLPANDEQLAIARVDRPAVNPLSDILRQPLANLSLHQSPYSDMALSATTARRSHYESSFQQISLLGRGGFGRVYHAWNLFDKKEYAVKKIPLSARLSQRYRESGHQELENVLREVQALAQLEHQNVVRYHATWIEEPKTAPTARYEHKKPDLMIHGRKLITAQPISSQNSKHPPPLSVAELSDDGIVFGSDSASPAPLQMLESDAGLGPSMRHSDLDSTSARPSEIFTDGHARPNLQETDIDQSVYVLHVQMSLYPTTLAQYLAPVSGKSRSAPSNPIRRHCFHLTPALRILLGILCGLQYIHAKGLVHRDLKPSNVFLSSFDLATPGLVSEGFYDVGSCLACPHPNPYFVNPRIGDFGLVAELTQDDEHEHGTDTTASPRTKAAGTEYYRPPPWTDSKGKWRPHSSVNEKLDIFALGVVLVEMLWCCNTSSERSFVLRDLQKGKLPDGLREKVDQEGHEPGIGRLVWQCVQGMIEPDPRRRWGCAEVKDWVEMMLQKCKSSTADGGRNTAAVGADLSQVRSLNEEASAEPIPETDAGKVVEH